MNSESWGKLATELPHRMCNEGELAELLGWVSGRAVRRAVEHGELPPPIRLGRRNIFVVGVVRDYITNRAQVLARRVVNL